MYSQLAIIHRTAQSADRSESTFVPPHFLSWSTCLRSVLIGFHQDLDPSQIGANDEIFAGQEAYIFLLEVVCGMRSPILGETEVHGQYRDFLEKSKDKASRELYQILHQVHVHAKQIRTEFLQGLGSQSYGSYCRKKVRHLGEVHILGAGHLALELLPWLNKTQMQVCVHSRALKAELVEMMKQNPRLSVESLYESNKPLKGALLVAAPLSANEIQNWISKRTSQLELILDLRGESAHDPLTFDSATRVESLNQIFTTIEDSRANIRSEVAKAKEAITFKSMTLFNEFNNENSNSRSQERSRKASSLHSRASS